MLARDLSLRLRTERWNNEGRVGPRSVLYLLYLKQDQNIRMIVIITTSLPYKRGGVTLILLLPVKARGGAYPILDFHWFVLLND